MGARKEAKTPKILSIDRRKQLVNQLNWFTSTGLTPKGSQVAQKGPEWDLITPKLWGSL